MTWNQQLPVTEWNYDLAHWMGQLDDDILIRDLSIPGTHDSCAKRGFTHLSRSETQDWNVEQQLDNGIRFLDLRVKTKGSDELALWHGGDFIWDVYEPDSQDQLYFRTVYEKCVQWLAAHPRETIILSIKDESNEAKDFGSADAIDLATRVYRILTQVNRDHVSPDGFRGMWHHHDVSCTLREARGRMILWRRCATPLANDDARFPGVDLTDLSRSHDNTRGAVIGDGTQKLFDVQDFYEENTLEGKAERWLRLAQLAFNSRHDASHSRAALQPLNFGSKAGSKNPEANAAVMNPLIRDRLAVTMNKPSGPPRHGKSADPADHHFRSGYGVIPLDFPDSNLIDIIIRMNFWPTYDIDAFQSGHQYIKDLIARAAQSD